jgi:phospholipid transport system substrate-binding protein
VCLFCIVLVGRVSAAPMTPTETVQAAISEVLAILKEHQGADREQRWQAIGRVINAKFDFRSMSQSVLARSWRAATPEEKRQFVEYFSQYLEDTYRTKIESYTDQKVEYISEQVRKDRAVVETEIVTAQARVPVTYRLKNNDGRWFAYDVVIEGVSLVNNYRNTFSAIIKAEGMDGLLTDLEGRIANYKAKHGGPPVTSTAPVAPKPAQ